MASRKKKSNSSRSDGSKTPSHTAQILEHVELLVALHEEQSDSGGSSAASDTSALVDDISQKLESQLSERFDSLKDQIASSDSKHDNDDSNVDNSLLNSILERFDTLDSKLTAIEDKTQDSDGPQLSAAKIQERFEALDNRLAKITAAIEGQQQLIEEQNQNADPSDIDALQRQFSKMLNQMKQEMESIEAIQQNSDNPDLNDGEPRGPDWSEQKQAMLSKYGINPEHRPDMDPPTEPDPVLETTMADEQLSASTEIETSDEDIASEEDPEEIQKVKKELKAKLRDAEVELSIERAKLSQLEAELQAKQIELDRRDSELTQKLGSRKKNSSVEDDESFLDRLKKHLTAKDRKNLDRI